MVVELQLQIFFFVVNFWFSAAFLLYKREKFGLGQNSAEEYSNATENRTHIIGSCYRTAGGQVLGGGPKSGVPASRIW